MIRPSFKRDSHSDAAPAVVGAPFDAAALMDAVRELEEKLEAVTQRESDYREAVTRLEEEVQAAGALQRALLPVNPPEIDGGEISILYRPHSTVSGDIYDVFRIDERYVGFALADATGHGMPAALLSTMIRRTLRGVGGADQGEAAPNPERVLERVNDELLALGLDDCQFAAGLFGVFDERTGAVRLARGGTPYPVVLGADGTPRVIQCDGPILGAMSDPTFEVAEFELSPGERLLIYTDGVEPLIEAGADAESLAIAWSRFLADCETSAPGDDRPMPTKLILECLERRVARDHARHDDVTVVALERTV